MNQENELARLEQFVSKLRQGFRELKTECARLVATVEKRDATIADLEAKLADRLSEREDISDRVNRLIGQIEELELSGDEMVPVSHHPMDDRQRNLFPLD
jgi:predicted RNase H-like nuclease (RuvC/YqgF family)